MSVSSCTEEQFIIYKQHWSERLSQISLPEDINSHIGQVILSQLDECYAYLRVDLGEIESAKERSESIIRQNERSKAVGKNEDDRKKNATEFLENYQIDGETYNMYDYHRTLISRYLIIKSFVDIINNKQQRLITMSGFMKIDSNLTTNNS